MKKIISMMLILALGLVGTLGCGPQGTPAAADSGSVKIVTTIFPEYDWIVNVLGENSGNAEITLLLDNGVDLHSYQPSVNDILTISTCDLFIYVGGESDKWVDDALKESQNEDMIVINLLEMLGDQAKEEEIVEGMEGHDHDHDHEEEHEDHDHEEEHDDHEEHDHDHEEAEYDEHVWLSLRNTVLFVNRISEELQKIDPEHAEAYSANAARYVEALNVLDKKYSETVSEASVKTVLFGDRFPFRYLTDDYGLSYYAAFVGCSAETEASFETITFLAKKVDELGLSTVLTIEGNDHRIAETIVGNTASKDQKILTLDSMQAITSKDIENGATYLSIMENNLSVLKEALN